MTMLNECTEYHCNPYSSISFDTLYICIHFAVRNYIKKPKFNWRPRSLQAWKALFDVLALELPTGIIDLLFLILVAFLWVFFE